ncbi:MAG: ankyrin repeat domain-containing protein, partial [Candidatus Solibacter usitatus]|nr:ankyrin repeat domain-containing protein [Candidatus Solibacter usitatus]
MIRLASLFAISLIATASSAPLADAAKRKDRSAVRALLGRRVEVNAPQADGTTALHWAAHQEDLETAELLVRAGANVKAANRYGVTPLSLACTGKVEAVKSLLSHKADAHAKEGRRGQTALMWAAAEGHVEVVEALIQAGADFRARLDSGFTPLLFAVREGQA